MSYFCTAMVSAVRLRSTLCSEAWRLRTPLAAGSSGLSGKISNSSRPRIALRLVIVACAYASLTATMVRSGVNTK